MTNFHFPTDGSVVIVDDQIEDALPLIRLLSSLGTACTYYSGTNDDELPEKAVQKVRLAFFDIQLIPGSSSHQYATMILSLLDRLIPDDNGPYALILWSERLTDHADDVETEIKAPANPKKPLAVIRMDKTSFLKREYITEKRDVLVEQIADTMADAIAPEDLSKVLELIKDRYSLPEVKVPLNGAAQKLLADLDGALESQVNSFQLFTVWESLVNKAAGITVNNYAALYKELDHWDSNIKHAVYVMAHAQLGKKVDGADKGQLVRSALKTVGQTFLDEVENRTVIAGVPAGLSFDRDDIGYKVTISDSTYKIKWRASTGKYQFFKDGTLLPQGSEGSDNLDDMEASVIKQMNRVSGSDPAENARIVSEVKNLYLAIKPEIHTKLHVDMNAPDFVYPGNIYKCSDLTLDKRKEFLKTYFKPGAASNCIVGNDGIWRASDADLQSVIFIELEVSPPCDVANDKWIKSRFLPGVLIPVTMQKYKSGETKTFYEVVPIKIDDVEYQMKFDFRLFKSLEKSKAAAFGRPMFRIRHELYADIVSHLSAHISRLGITSIA